MSRRTGRCSAGTRGWNFPDNYDKAVQNRFFVDSVVFTLKYTDLATVLLLGLGLGLALLVQESTRWKGLLRTSFLVPSALGLASASLLFYVLYSPLAGPAAPADEQARLDVSSARPTAALWSTLFLIVWRYAGFYMLLMLVGLQRIPPEVLRGGAHRRRRAAGRSSAPSPCRCCGPRSRCPRCSA